MLAQHCAHLQLLAVILQGVQLCLQRSQLLSTRIVQVRMLAAEVLQSLLRLSQLGIQLTLGFLWVLAAHLWAR
jgi:hypothetical protein